jgi:hypothetical protein
MSLAADDVRYATLRSLGGEDIFSYLIKDVLIKIKEFGDYGNDVRAS